MTIPNEPTTIYHLSRPSMKLPIDIGTIVYFEHRTGDRRCEVTFGTVNSARICMEAFIPADATEIVIQHHWEYLIYFADGTSKWHSEAFVRRFDMTYGMLMYAYKDGVVEYNNPFPVNMPVRVNLNLLYYPGQTYDKAGWVVGAIKDTIIRPHMGADQEIVYRVEAHGGIAADSITRMEIPHKFVTPHYYPPRHFSE